MKPTLLLILSIIHSIAWGQGPAMKNNTAQQQITIKKQIVVDDLENQIKDTPLAAVRVLARYKLAAWLWRNGKDETGRAEQLIAKALDELYEKKGEIPDGHFRSLSSNIFALLETNKKELAKTLRAKYSLDSEDELNNADSLLNMKDGEKAAADKIQKSLANKTELSSMTIWLLQELQSRKSPELQKILAEIISLQESGQSNFSAESLFFVVDFFRNTTVSNDLRIKFYNLVSNKAKAAIQFPDSDATSIYDLLNAVMQDISKNAPNLLPEARTLQYIFRSRVPPSVAKSIESYNKIEENPDRLNALISEAEARSSKGLKADLLTQAAQLALKNGKFRLSIELVDQVKANTDEEKDERFSLWYDQFLSDVSEKALKEDDIDSSKYAADRVINKLTLANVLRNRAIYFYKKRDLISAAGLLDNALKLADNANNDLPKIYLLIRLVFTIQKIDPNRISEVIEKTAKAINTLPRLAMDDRPESDNYRKYVDSIMAINERLMPAFAELVKGNKSEAINFASRIDTKEIKLMLNSQYRTKNEL
jgi:hypothetical protein